MSNLNINGDLTVNGGGVFDSLETADGTVKIPNRYISAFSFGFATGASSTRYLNGYAQGYLIFDNGVKFQWGYISSVTSNSVQSATITFPTAFATTGYIIFLQEIKNNDTTNDTATGGDAIYSKSTTSCVISTYSWTNGRYWFAIGN